MAFNGMQDQEYIDEYDHQNAMGGGGYLDQGPTSLPAGGGGGRGGWGVNSDPWTTTLPASLTTRSTR